MAEGGKGRKRQRFIYIFVAIAVLLGAVMVIGFDSGLAVVAYEIESGKLQSGIRAVVVSDLHSCYYGEGQKDLVDAIHACEPDLLLFTGDICDMNLPHDNTRILLNKVARRYPCFYVSGNHEYWSGGIVQIKDLFRSYGVRVLVGGFETIGIRGEYVNICGVDDPETDEVLETGRTFGEQLEKLANAADNGYFTILLAHRPERIGEYRKYPFDLILSGHTHGGQWRIPRIANGLFAPDQGLFPKYAGGEYSFPDTTMIVSCGLARESIGIPRLFNRSELVVVTIGPENSN